MTVAANFLKPFRVRPAVEAGIADQVWSVVEIAGLLGEAVRIMVGNNLESR